MDRQVVPYQDQQILKFRNDSNNEVFEVTVSNSEFSNDYDYSMCSAECCDVWKNIEVRLIEFNSATRQEFLRTVVVYPHSEEGKGEIMFVQPSYFDKKDTRIQADASIIYDNEYALECFPEHCEQSLTIGNDHFESVNKVRMHGFTNDDSFYETLVYYYTKDKGILKITHEISEYRVNQQVVISTEEYFAVL